MALNVFEQMGYKLGYKKDSYDNRDYVHMLPLVMPDMPDKIDLRDKIKTIFKQSYSDCSANVICNNIMSLKDDNNVVSSLFTYYNSRFVQDPVFITDNGTTYRDALKGLQKFGFVYESEYDYIDEHLNNCPNDNIYECGEKNKYIVMLL